MSLRLRWAERLGEIREEGLERRLRPLTMRDATRGEVDGRDVEVFSSNDYLGLAHHQEMRKAWKGGGAGSSRLIAGSRPSHRDLEDALEELFGKPALVFSSGYQANLAVMSTLFDASHTVGSDRFNHASIIDGLRLSACEVTITEHGVFDLSADVQVAEGLYSMDGDVVDLQQNPEQPLVVDEAHAVGAVGPEGRGVCAQQGRDPDVLIGTFGKAYGAAGAFVVLDQDAKDLLISAGRSFIYTTALAEPAVRAAMLGLKLANDGRREKLAGNVKRFREGLKELGVTTRGDAHIVPVVLGDRTMEMAEALFSRGVYVPGIRYPTVARGDERLRFSLSSEHSDAAIDGALGALEKCLH